MINYKTLNSCLLNNNNKIIKNYKYLNNKLLKIVLSF